MRLGTDPEIFLCDNTGKHYAINGYINAGKANPMQIPDMPPGFTLQEDNVALEYGVPPAANAEEFAHHIRAVMEKSREYIPSNLDFSKLSCTIFTDDQLKHPMAKVFGCEPDWNAYTRKHNPRPVPTHPGLRSAGGHIHVETKLPTIKTVTSMDLFLGVPSVVMDDGQLRKQLYGKAGAFRPKKYGVEYRTLSNFWVLDDKLIKWVWRNTERALACLDLHEKVPEVQDCINNNDTKLAWAIINEYNLEVV